MSNSLCRLQRKVCAPHLAARVATLHGQVQARMLRVDLTSDNRIRSTSGSGRGGSLARGLRLGSLTLDFWSVLATGRQSQGSRSWGQKSGGSLPPFPTALGAQCPRSLPRGHFATHPTSPKLSNSQSCWGQGHVGCERALGTSLVPRTG